MTNRAEFERLLDVYGFRCERFGQDLSTHARAQVVSAFAALASAPVAGEETDADIRAVFLAHGFTVKEGQTDLKPYVYAAARALLSRYAAPQASEAQDLEAALGAALCRANSAEAMWHKYRDELKALKAQASEAVRDAAFEAVRKQLCKLPRYSFFVGPKPFGGVQRVEDRSGTWIEFDAVHALFDPVSVDAALSAQPGAQKGGSDG